MKKISHYTNETLKIELELGEVTINSSTDSRGRKTTSVELLPRYVKGSKKVVRKGKFISTLVELKTVRS